MNWFESFDRSSSVSNMLIPTWRMVSDGIFLFIFYFFIYCSFVMFGWLIQVASLMLYIYLLIYWSDYTHSSDNLSLLLKRGRLKILESFFFFFKKISLVFKYVHFVDTGFFHWVYEVLKLLVLYFLYALYVAVMLVYGRMSDFSVMLVQDVLSMVACPFQTPFTCFHLR